MSAIRNNNNNNNNNNKQTYTKSCAEIGTWIKKWRENASIENRLSELSLQTQMCRKKINTIEEGIQIKDDQEEKVIITDAITSQIDVQEKNWKVSEESL
ncbi:hypothetical protein RFI_07383, partial [Reticulomyxa filosa]